jgi:membrane-bound serine protease (ClpP class)
LGRKKIVFEAFLWTLVGFAAILFDLLFLPGGLLVTGGVILIFYAIYRSYQLSGWWGALIHLALCLLAAPKLIRWSLSRVALKGEVFKKEAGFVATPNLSSHVGRKGEAVSDLRPSGKILLQGEDDYFDAISEGGFIEKGRKIEVIAVDLGQLVVREMV